MALVHPVEALEDPALLLRRDADAGILHGEGGGGAVAPHGDGDAAAVHIVLHGVVAEVAGHLPQKGRDAGDDGALPLEGQGDVPLGGGIPQGVHGVLRDGVEVHRLEGGELPLVQLGEADDVPDEGHEALGLGADVAHEAGDILGLHEAVFQELGAAQDALEGGLQLVGDVGGELPPGPLGALPVRDVEGQDHGADGLAVGVDAAEVELVVPAVPLLPELAVAAVHAGAEGQAHVMAPVHGEEVLAGLALLGAEDPPGGGVDAEDGALGVQEDQALPHAAGDLAELVALAAELRELAVDLLALAVDAAQQWRELLIAVVLQGVLQVQGVEGLHDPLGKAAREERAEGQGRREDDEQGLQRPQKEAGRGGPARGEAEDRPVPQALGPVHGLLQQRGGGAAVRALAVGQGVLDLLAAGVVFHGGGVRLAVIEDGAVPGHPGDADGAGGQGLQVIEAPPLHRRGGELQLLPQLPLLQIAEVGVEDAHDGGEAREERHRRRQQDGSKDLSGHGLPSRR